MLQMFGLDIHYMDGRGDYLTHLDELGKKIQVLDVVGSYGINLCGHKNEIVRNAIARLSGFPPNFIQGSRNPEKEKLFARLENLMEQHTGKKNWKTELANTGTEIVELALKLALRRTHAKRVQWRQEKVRTLSLAKKVLPEECDNICQTYNFLDEMPVILYLKGGFHGKTLGSLSAMSNPQYKQGIQSALRSVEVEVEPAFLEKTIEQFETHYLVYNSKTGTLQKKRCCPIAAIILEPIQGENGVQIVPSEFLRGVSKIQKQWGIPVISDEVQCGLYRTGRFSALHPDDLVADIYCFGKSLGAGLAKISALCYQYATFEDDVYGFHSSSFSEDTLGCVVANNFLHKFESSPPAYFPLKQQLKNFAVQFPKFIKEIRGSGLMVAIELNKEAIHTSFLAKFFYDLNVLGYLISSVLLHREKIRIFPTLSAPLSFRVQPSIHFSHKEFDWLCKGLTRLFSALENNDLDHLFGHLLPIEPGVLTKPLPEGVQQSIFPEQAAVFICHPIDLPHLSHIVDLVGSLPDEKLNAMLDEVREEQEFTVYHTDVLQNTAGDKMPVVFLGIPLTSASFFRALREGKRSIWIEKIQRAVDWANIRNARSIGLGQYTSIITGNGQYIHSPTSVLTTGNAYTVGLAVQAVQQVMNERQMDTAHICVVGAGGNIASVISTMLANRCHTLTLIFRQNPETSSHVKEKVRTIQEEIKNANVAKSPLIVVSNTISAASQADIVILSTNQPGAVLYSEHVKNGAIVLDVSVPPNASDDLRARNDITYINGGIASLPLPPNLSKQFLNSVILPFGPGECFACMAETFALGFANNQNQNFTGDLSQQTVEHIIQIAESQGFGLGRMKTEVSL